MKNIVNKSKALFGILSKKINQVADGTMAGIKKLSKSSPTPLHEELDERLILSLSSKKKIPSWQQLKFIGRFLIPREKKTIGLLSLVIVAALISLGAEFILKHRVSLPASGGEFTEGVVGYPQTINPLFSSLNNADADLSRLIYAGLLKYTTDMKLAPDLAESFTISKDNKTISIKLKPNLLWQDNEPLTTDDVGFTISRLQEPATQSPLWVSFQGVIFIKIDSQNFTLELPQPFSPFLRLLTVGLLPEHLWQDVAPANMKLSSINLKPVGAGPFMFSAFSKDGRGNIKSYTLKTNPNYHATKPFLKNVTFKFFNDFESGLEALRNHQINALNSLPKDQKDKIFKKSINTRSLRLPYFSALFFNQKRNLLLRSLPLRQAMAMSLDRNQMVSSILKDEGAVVNGPILPGQLGFTQDFKIKYDARKAQEILDSDGWKKISRAEFIEKRKQELYQAWVEANKVKAAQDGQTSLIGGQGAAKNKKPTPEEAAAQKKATDEFLERVSAELNEVNSRQTMFRHKNNFGLAVKLTTLNQSEFVQTAAFVKDAWQDMGMQVDVELLELNELKETIKNRDYEILLYGVLTGADPDPYPFWHSSQISSPGVNLANYNNRSADELSEKARATFDEAERAKLYYNFQKTLMADLPAVFLYTTTYLYPMDITLKGFNQYRIFQPADRFAGVTGWYLRTKSGWR